MKLKFDVFGKTQPDPFIFEDGDKLYLYASGVGDAKGVEVYSSDDLFGIWHYEGLAVANSAERRQYWAPSVIKHEGKYYMTYSANSYECPEYGVGVAVADNPEGPWVKYDSNPVLQSVDGLEGVGHHALFKDAKGRNRIVFHSHNAPGKVQPRIIHIGYFGFKNVRNSSDVFVVKKKFFTPCMSQQ